MYSKQITRFYLTILLPAALSTGCVSDDNDTMDTEPDTAMDSGADGEDDAGVDTDEPTTCVFRSSDLPLPTGPYCIGAIDYHFEDPDRGEPFTPDDDEDKREVMVRIFYPAQPGADADFGEYLTSETLQSAAAEAGIPDIDEMLAAVPVQYHPNAPIAEAEVPFPLLLFSPGFGMAFQEYTALLEDMASHGYIVAAVNHPYLSRVTQLPDDRAVAVTDFDDSLESWAVLDENFSLLVGDLQLVLDEIISLSDDSDSPFDGRVDVDDIGVIGHSLGGAAALSLTSVDPRVTAGVNMDGSLFYETMAMDSVNKSILIHLAGTHTMLSDPSIARYWRQAKGEKYAVAVETAGHLSYSDWPTLIGAFFPGASIGEAVQGTVDPVEMIALVREANRTFFDAHLKHDAADLAEALSQYEDAAVMDADETPQLPKRTSLYLEMSDGTRIAADVWLPVGADEEHPVSTVVRATRYWRDVAILNRTLYPLSYPEQEALMWTGAGMALISVDVRGTGASFGSWTAPWSEREVADFEEIVDWIIDQEWSDGQVAAQGVSYEGNTADFFGLIGHEAVKAVAPLFTDWNAYTDITYPGGIYNAGFIDAWNMADQALDKNDVCAAQGITDPNECEMTKRVVSGVLPVDEDEDQALLEAAVAEHADNLDVFEACGGAPYLDSDVGNTHYLAISPATQTESLDPDAATYLVKASWTDAVTANGALSRYMTTDNDTVVYIGAWSHGGEYNTDPFLAADAPTFPSIAMQESNMVLQFSKLFSGVELSPKREIHYYVLGAKAWRTTTVWPPEDTAAAAFHLRSTGELTLEGGESDEPPIDYKVDFTASSGATNRWWTQLGGNDVIYPDRSAEDEKLLTYTSSPLEESMLLAGHPEIYIHLASTHEDGAVYVYLEDVAPEGTVTYLTEGQLRLIHRKVSDNPPEWHVFGPYHSFLEADTAPMVPGEPAEIAIMLQPLAALIEAGHSLRVALAGHDASNFVRLPESGDPTLTVYHDTDHPSRIVLPVN